MPFKQDRVAPERRLRAWAYDNLICPKYLKLGKDARFQENLELTGIEQKLTMTLWKNSAAICITSLKETVVGCTRSEETLGEVPHLDDGIVARQTQSSKAGGNSLKITIWSFWKWFIQSMMKHLLKEIYWNLVKTRTVCDVWVDWWAMWSAMPGEQNQRLI